MVSSNRSLGAWGEAYAVHYLNDLGFEFLERNVRSPHGEIDLIMQRDGMIHFIEVKTRSNDRFGPPETSVTEKKQAHLIASAEFYMQSHPQLTCSWQIDVLSIQSQPGNPDPSCEFFENAVH